MSNMHTHLDTDRLEDLAKDTAEHPRRARPVEAENPVLRALSAAEAAFNKYAAHHLRQANKPGEDKHKRLKQAGENADLAQSMREGILAHFAQSHAIPKGWQAVPCEPTREMLDKARENLVRDGEIDPMLKSIYSAMLGTTPKLATSGPTKCADAQQHHNLLFGVDWLATGLAARLNDWSWGSDEAKTRACREMAWAAFGLMNDLNGPQVQTERQPLTNQKIWEVISTASYDPLLEARAIERACAEAWGVKLGGVVVTEESSTTVNGGAA